MANTISFSGRMPAEENNGLKTYARQILAEPGKTRYIIAVVDVEETRIRHAKRVQVPRMEFLHIELVDDDHATEASALLSGLLARRTGADQLPFPFGADAPREESDDFPEDENWAKGQEGDDQQ